MAINVEKIVSIGDLASLIAELSFGDANLVMKDLGLNEIWFQNWNDDPDGRWFVSIEDRKDYLKANLSDLTINELKEGIAAVAAMVGKEPKTQDLTSASRSLALFASHISAEKEFVQKVALELKKRGVEMFVAHSSIEPSEDWQVEIERSLSTCHGAVAFVHRDFDKSDWCYQELGWMKGRNAPFLMVLFDDELPKGMFVKTQGQRINGTADPSHLADLILRWAGKYPEFDAALGVSAIEEFCASKSFAATDQAWARVLKLDSIDANRVEQILAAVEVNDQIYGANCRAAGSGADFGKKYPEVVLNFLFKFGQFSECKPLALRVAKFHGLTKMGDLLGAPF